MKAFVCEMCNSQDLVKQDGYFVCQSCGTKYSIEEAKKLMVEIEGAVKVDNSDYVERYLQNDRCAKSKEDWAEVEKYYNMVEQNQPNNIEAIFYSAYGKAKQSLVDGDIFKRQAAFKVLNKSVSVLDDNYDISEEAQLCEILDLIAKDVLTMCDSEFFYTEKKDQYGNSSNNSGETYALFNLLVAEAITTYENIWKKFPAAQQSSVVYIQEILLTLVEHMAKGGRGGYSNFEMHKSSARKCDEIAATIKRFQPNFTKGGYEQRVLEAEAEYKKTSAGCGIAFAIVAIAIIAFVVVLCCI